MNLRTGLGGGVQWVLPIAVHGPLLASWLRVFSGLVPRVVVQGGIYRFPGHEFRTSRWLPEFCSSVPVFRP